MGVPLGIILLLRDLFTVIKLIEYPTYLNIQEYLNSGLNCERIFEHEKPMFVSAIEFTLYEY